jgi:hypothetical protein
VEQEEGKKTCFMLYITEHQKFRIKEEKIYMLIVCSHYSAAIGIQRHRRHGKIFLRTLPACASWLLSVTCHVSMHVQMHLRTFRRSVPRWYRCYKAPHTHTVWPSIRPAQLKTERQN